MLPFNRIDSGTGTQLFVMSYGSWHWKGSVRKKPFSPWFEQNFTIIFR